MLGWACWAGPAGLGLAVMMPPLPPPDEPASTLPRRVQMYSLMILSVTVCKVIRFSLPSVVPVMCASLGYGTTETAAVLAAFFPGYLISQVPSGPIVQKWGGKMLNTLNIGGGALCIAGPGCCSIIPNAGLGRLPGHGSLSRALNSNTAEAQPGVGATGR